MANDKIKHELLDWCDMITKWNIFPPRNKQLFIQNGVGMGTPSLALLLWIFIQFIESGYIMKLSTKHNVVGYFHYVDDILSLWQADPSSRGVLPSVGLS